MWQDNMGWLWQASSARGLQIHSSGQGLFMQGLARGLLPQANQWGEYKWCGSSGCRICFWNWEECNSPAWDWVCYCSNPLLQRFVLCSPYPDFSLPFFTPPLPRPLHHMNLCCCFTNLSACICSSQWREFQKIWISVSFLGSGLWNAFFWGSPGIVFSFCQ
jgi:hypothetical protein